MRVNFKIHYTYVFTSCFELRLRQGKMSTSSDGIPTEMSEDENKTLHRHTDRR